MKILTADFPGASFPPETKVWFETQTGSRRNGTIQRLFSRYARVAAADGTLWKVPYRLLIVGEPIQKPAITLSDIDTLGNQLLQEHEDKSCLAPGWKFGFDLAPARGGICRHIEKQITLSVTYCLKASEAEIADTISTRLHMRSLVLSTNTMRYGRQQHSTSGVLLNVATESNTRSRAGGGNVDAESSGNDNV